MKLTRNPQALSCITLLAAFMSPTAFAQETTLLNCQWQESQNNDAFIEQQKSCTNVPGATAEPVNVASRYFLKTNNQCLVNPKGGYIPELAGRIMVTDNGYCDTTDVYFQADAATRVINDVQEILLSCRWEVLAENDTTTSENYQCDDINGNKITQPLALRTTIPINSYCNIMPLVNSSNSAIDGGQVVIGEPLDCEVGPVYFRPFPASREVNGVTETLQQCSWDRVFESGSVYSDQRTCSNINGSGIDKVVAMRTFDGVKLTSFSLIEGANSTVAGGTLTAAKELDADNPPIYYRP